MFASAEGMVSDAEDMVRPAIDVVQGRMTCCGCRKLINRSNPSNAADEDV